MRPATDAATSHTTAQPRKTNVTVEVERSALARDSSSTGSVAGASPVCACSACRAPGLAAGSSTRPTSRRAKITWAPRPPGSSQPLVIATMKKSRATMEIMKADSRMVVAMGSPRRDSRQA